MSYVVLARKWRPRFFEEVIGQGHVAKTLTNAIEQQRVAHAYLFCGPRGVGKTSTARILAKALNCAQGPAPKPCYECPSCLEITEGQAIDVLEIDGASNRGINEIRTLREGVRYTPSRSRFKIYIIDEVHMLTTEAFNALLKTLEEPPPHVKFIFATTEPQKIPVTILSRCQRFDFKRISQSDTTRYLADLCRREEIEAEQDALHLLSRQAAGGMRDALSLLDQVISFAGKRIVTDEVAQILGVANRAHLFDLSGAIVLGDAEAALTVLDEIHRYGYDLLQFAGELVNHLRDMMVVRVTAQPQRVCDLTTQELQIVRQQIEGIEPELLHRYFSVMLDGAQEMSRSPYPKLLFEMTLVRLCQLEPLVSVDLLVDRLLALEEGLGDEDDKKKTERPAVAPRAATPAPAPSSPAPTPAAPLARAPERQAPAPAPAPEARRPSTPPRVEARATPAQPAPPAPTPSTPPAPAIPTIPAIPAMPQRPEPVVEAPAPTPAPPAQDQPKIPTEPETEAQIAWAAIVEAVRANAAPLAATLEHAHPLVEGDQWRLGFTSAYYLFMQDEGRVQPLHDAIAAHHAGVQVSIERASDDWINEVVTLAQIRLARIDAQRAQIEADTMGHPVVATAVELFEPVQLRTEVKLDEG